MRGLRASEQAACLVTACSVSAGARLGTGNVKDFPMSELEVEPGPVGT